MSKGRVPTISPSQLDAMGCRLAWWLGYKEGYRAKKSNMALELGTGIHYGLEMYYKEGRHPAEAFNEWAVKRISQMNPQWNDDIASLKEAQELGNAMLNGYYEHYMDKDDFKVITTEHTLRRRLPIYGRGTYAKCYVVTRLDGLVRDMRTGKIFGLEHKTFTKLNLGHFDRDHQITAQIWTGQELLKTLGIDEPIHGVIYNGLRKQAPGPKVKNELFVRHKIYRTQRDVDVFLHRAYNQYRELMLGKPAIYPQPNAIRCNTCDFKEVCTEYHRGGDWKFILKEMYHKRGEERDESNDTDE